ncbi:alpha/beta hydrolase [Salegentibacter sediminis]|uniref:alpha/beta hydrolase n=1 Tax=Salegentibacter sediminis TaxID=1930251 RepID=UPI0009BF8E50|nr:alpha/beta hydrolase [Salegentibacter sediminis]
MKKRYWIILILLLVLVVTYFSGPKPINPNYTLELPEIPSSNLKLLEDYLKKTEAKHALREDNQARIKWQEEPPQVTEYSIVYLHGFAGSYRDAYPVNVNIADSLNANIYLARWAGHGMKPEVALKDFTPETAWNSAKEALVIGNRIGKKVIIMSTSTGGTLAIKLAAAYPDMVYALINLAPNTKDDQTGSFVLNSPWGYEIAGLVSFGEHKIIEHEQKIAEKYWDTIYPSKALVDLQILVGSTMKPETFSRLNCPVLTLYYKENYFQKDNHVEVSSYPEVHEAFSTVDSLKKLVALSTPETHFIGSDIKSKDTKSVEKEIMVFLKEDLGITIP